MNYKGKTKFKKTDLLHFGVKGMRWRHRKSSGSAENSSRSVFNRRSSNRAAIKAHQKSYKNRANLSDAELKAQINRIEMENRYKRAIKESKQSNSMVGQKVKESLVNTLVPMAVTAAVVGGTNYAINRKRNGGKLSEEQMREVGKAVEDALLIKAMPKKK